MKTIDLLTKQDIDQMEQIITDFWGRHIDEVGIMYGKDVFSKDTPPTIWCANWLVSLMSEFLEENKEQVNNLLGEKGK